jgi:uncharacterized protein (DUF427 family)
MHAVLNGVVIAESDDTVVVEGNYYFPADSVTGAYLVDSRMRTLCPWKGVARYKTVTVNGMSAPHAAWYYPRPSPFARRIKGRFAFWHGVIVEPSPPRPGEVPEPQHDG